MKKVKKKTAGRTAKKQAPDFNPVLDLRNSAWCRVIQMTKGELAALMVDENAAMIDRVSAASVMKEWNMERV